MLSTASKDILFSLKIINDNTTINFERIRQLGLVLLHKNGVVWLQPFDKEIIPEFIDIVTNPHFLSDNSEIRLSNHFQPTKITNYTRKKRKLTYDAI